MQTWTSIDKKDWEPGPWMEEPDKAHWIDKNTDLDCLIVRGALGALCGYVGVTEGHAYFGFEYYQCHQGCEEEKYCSHAPENLIEVHGGLTYSDFCQPSDDPGKGVCHVPINNRTDNIWWFGFDCAHYGDIYPGDTYLGIQVQEGSYKDLEYVKQELVQMAGQLCLTKST